MVTGQQQIMTFYVAEVLFGFDIKHVLLLGRDMSLIAPLSTAELGLVGTIKIQDVVMPVVDFSRLIGLHSATDEKKAFLSQLATVKQGYLDWFQEIQRKLTVRQIITDNELNQNVSLLNWDTQIQGHDLALKAILTTLKTPKTIFLNCLDNLKGLITQHQWQQAEMLLEQQKELILTQIEDILDKAEAHIESSAKQILLYLTKEGVTPSLVIIIEEVYDVLSYSKSDFHSLEIMSREVIPTVKQVADGLYIKEGMPDCFYINANKINELAQQLTFS